MKLISIEDYIITPDGRWVGRLDHLFKTSINVREAQIIQDSISELIVKIVPNNYYSSLDEKHILKEAKLRLGTDMKIIFEYVEEIPRLKSGKYKFVVSNLKKHKFYKKINSHIN